MTPRIIDHMAQQRPCFSFELYPPKTEKGRLALFRAAEELAKLEPTYVSVTYGAGGSTSKTTLEIATELQEKLGLLCLHHLTLVNRTAEEIRRGLDEILSVGCRNILALRGDPPPEMGGFRPVPGGYSYSYELIDLIHEVAGPEIGVAVAGFPEGHIDCPSLELDTVYLKNKFDHGAQFAVTQLFFENQAYKAYRERTGAAGITQPIVPGLLPIVDYTRLQSFCSTCGATIPPSVDKVFAPLAEDAEAMGRAGTEWAIRQGRELLAMGAPGIHFYCLNRAEPVRTIWRELKGS